MEDPMAMDKKLIDQLLTDYKKSEDTIGENGLLKELTKAILERALAAQMTIISMTAAVFCRCTLLFAGLYCTKFREELMDSNSFDVTTAVGTSGWYLRLAVDGHLEDVSALVLKRTKLATDLAAVEKLLLACNDHRALSEFAVWCLAHSKSFISELIKRNKKLEVRKAMLQIKLREIDGRLAELPKEEPMGDEWTTNTEPMTSLVPKIVRNPDQRIEQRNDIIDQNLEAPTSRICVLLDKHFTRDGIVPPGFLPERWIERFAVRNFVNAYRDPRCRNCVEKMISLRRRRARYLRN
jgi:hypothetical protein